MKLHPFFGRVGSKRFLKDEVFCLMPNNYDIYVEPFVGGGAVFLALDTKKPIIISDIDSELMNAYSLLQSGCEGDIKDYDIKDIPTLQQLKDGTPTTKMGKLVKYMIKSSNTFGNKGFGKVYKTTNPYNKLKHLDKYQAKLNNTTILTGNYKEIMRATDGPDTFFYLDPPYCGTKGLYINEKFNHDDLLEFLKTIKGRWLLSLDGSVENRVRFRDFSVQSVEQVTQCFQTNAQRRGGSAVRSELLIKNY